MPQLTLVPQGGLCNRLRAIASVRHLLEHAPEWSVRVAWHSSRECAARWEDLFSPDCWTHPRLSIEPAQCSDVPVSRHNLHLPALLRRVLGYDAQWKNFHSQLTPQGLLAQMQPFEKLYISSGYALLPTPDACWQGLKAQDWLEARVQQLTSRFDQHTIGLHIRRTDNVLSHQYSPDHLWFSAIEEILAHDSSVCFYLATDDASLKSQLLSRYPAHMMAQTCRGTRSNLQGMEEALIDLLALARCARLLGSYWSSFSETAALLGNIPLQVITTQS